MKRLKSIMWGLAVVVTVAIAGAWPYIGFFVAIALIYANIIFGSPQDQDETGATGTDEDLHSRDRSG